MAKSSARNQANFLAPHPLALRLLEEASSKDVRVLEIGRGSGRNERALRLRGAAVTSIESGGHVPAGAEFDAVLSTHALLHGTPATLGASLEAVHAALRSGGRLYGALGSKRDARYGTGTRISEHVFAPAQGDEAGVAHVYWDETDVRALLKDFSIVDLAEIQVDDVAGAWAHAAQPLTGAFHWIVVAQKP